MKRTILLLAVGLGVASGVPGADARPDKSTVYRAPYQLGPTSPAPNSSPDPRNPDAAVREHKDIDPATGKMTLLRANGTPGAIGCGTRGIFGYFRVEHPVNDVVTRVSVVYEKAAITPFTWLKVNVYGTVDGVSRYLGSEDLRGQLVGDSGTLVANLDDAPDLGTTLTVDFGMEAASACPNTDGGTATFPAVSVNN